MLFSRSAVITLLAAFGVGLVTAELLDPPLPCTSDDMCSKPCKDSVYVDFENDVTPTCKKTKHGPRCDCALTSDDNCLDVCKKMFKVDYPAAKVLDGYQDNGSGGCCCEADCKAVKDPALRKDCEGKTQGPETDKFCQRNH